MMLFRINGKTHFILLVALFWQLGLFSRPVISFFSDLGDRDFQVLISKPGVKELLRDMRAELRIGIQEFSEVRANSIQELNQMGIPVYIWIQSNDEEGRSFHVGNAASLLKLYRSFEGWSEEFGLSWQGIGIDLRPAPHIMKSWEEQSLVSTWNSYLNLFKQEEQTLAQGLFQEFREAVKQDKRRLEIYVLPSAIDEMIGGGKGYQFMGQTINLGADKIVPLCYTSSSYISPASILDYGKKAQNVAVGSTSSSLMGQQLPNQILTWEELSRDLRLAHDVCKEIHVSNLESIIANGWLEALAEFDFSLPVYLYSTELAQQENRSYINQKTFQALTYPILSSIGFVLAAIISAILLYFFLRYLLIWKKTKPASQGLDIDFEVQSA